MARSANQAPVANHLPVCPFDVLLWLGYFETEKESQNAAAGEMEPKVWIAPERVEPELEAAFATFEQDLRLAVIGKRWKVLGGRRPVFLADRHIPGDVHALRALNMGPDLWQVAEIDWNLKQRGRDDLCLHGLARTSSTFRKLLSGFEVPHDTLDADVEELLSRRLHAASVTSALARSEVYWLPSDTALAVMESTSPSDEMIDTDLRIHSRYATVFFQSGFEFPQDYLDNDEIGGAIKRSFEEFKRKEGGDQAINARLTGVVFCADGDERPTDDVLLLTSSAQPLAEVERKYGPWRSVQPDIRARNTALEPVLTNLAALVAWGDWESPDFPLDVPDIYDPRYKHWSKRPKTVAAQRKGTFGHVHQLDPKPVIDAKRDLPAAAEKRASPIEHKRRGHFKRVRVGTRDDWCYRTIYLLATTVMKGNIGDGEASPQKVYRLPLPKVQAQHTVG